MLRVRLRTRLQDLDPFATRGVDPSYSKGMRGLWLDNVLSSVSGAFMFTYISLYALALGATNAQIATLSSAASFSQTLAPIPGAQLTERWGSRRRVVVVFWLIIRSLSFLLVFIPFFLSGNAAIYAVIVLWAVRAGLANLAHPAWVSLAGDVIPAERRGGFFSRRNMAMALASMIFVPLAGRLIDWGGWPAGYQWSFSLSTVFGFAALYYYAQIPEPETHTRVARKRKGLVEGLCAMLGNRTFLFFALIQMLWNLSIQIGGPFFTVFQVKELGTTPGLLGLIEMTSASMRVIGQWFWGRVVDRQGSRRVLGICALLIPILPFVWFFMTKGWHALFALVPAGFLWAGFELAGFNLLLELPNQEERTQATAGYSTLIGIATIVGPLIGSWVIDHLGYYWDFGLSGVGRLLAAILFLVLLRPFRRAR